MKGSDWLNIAHVPVLAEISSFLSISDLFVIDWKKGLNFYIIYSYIKPVKQTANN